MHNSLLEFKNKEFLIANEADLKTFAETFAKVLVPSNIISLNGELGAGKTTFVRFLVNALGITVPVSSPSYVLENIYDGENISVSHWDLYRLKECPCELLEEEFKNTIVLIEWANKFLEVNDISDITLTFEILENGERKINIV